MRAVLAVPGVMNEAIMTYLGSSGSGWGITAALVGLQDLLNHAKENTHTHTDVCMIRAHNV